MLKTKVKEETDFGRLLREGDYLKKIPAVGDTVHGMIISTNRREVCVDIEGVTTGVIRGRELFIESNQYSDLNVGDTVEATVIDMENENGDMELSFRFAGQQKAWDELKQKFTVGEILPVKILEANKGGLIIRLNHITGFLPVSQLSPDHYPRVSGGDKVKILEHLKSYVDKSLDVRILDINEVENKLIVSEKVVWEERQKNVISKYKVGDTIEGNVTAVADFGVFVKFDGLEGLIHISEIAWQRIDHPKDFLKVDQVVKAEIIGIEGSKIFLSMKKLIDDPWSHVEEKYHVGDTVSGVVLKVNPFGLFVELDTDIHGLAHISELSDKPTVDINSIASIGETKTFKIVSLEPKEHRLGLSLKDLKKKEGSETSKKEKGKEDEIPDVQTT
ncbi:30S ribosomal protein S1 [Candidatus Uhrbacteria bacterium CG_4_9_14_3_um_filter_36_7]|uniref:30S ribosomal protein S1 n=1 Tax=Candidatus Uhrbacteria bacterium CG_4_9_14_3_um_filter_36_7 TaxID=1975033 RepID=A0A2M7XHE1_9BACT|nr:MAG: 30S ribosomal protein S1 [Candidatus Uhrbacteria bacterium CG_4_9_14_3_um_filter_36_7]